MDVVSDVMELYMCKVYIPVEVTTAALDGHLKVHKVVCIIENNRFSLVNKGTHCHAHVVEEPLL